MYFIVALTSISFLLESTTWFLPAIYHHFSCALSSSSSFFVFHFEAVDARFRWHFAGETIRKRNLICDTIIFL